ncbi:GEVED domain-containing protein [Chryseobacterium wanjuense]
MNSDPYFHVASIEQVQTNLNSKTCDIETNITNNPPVIVPLPDYTIPKGTAFVLSTTATDAENDPMTYAWEEYDSATSSVTTVTGNNTTYPLFRSWNPSATGNTRYFPKLSSVLAGNLTIPADWETVSNVARPTNFKLTVRDNNPAANSQQTQSDLVAVTVGNDGPFKVNTQYANVNTPTPIQWAVANTTAAPYNVANVKIDYTTDNGTTWTVLAASTPNDGSENFTFPGSMNGQTIKLRVSSIGNIFYAVSPVNVAPFQACDGSAPAAVTTSNITSSSVYVSWAPFSGATYIIRYKKTSDTTWQQTTSTSADVTISGLDDGTAYEVQVAAVCSGTPGTYSASVNFTTANITYCTLTSSDPGDEYISNVTLANVNNTSEPSTYTNYTTNSALVVNLIKGSTNNTVSVTKTWTGTLYNEAIRVWIDFNRDGTFDTSEMVMDSPPNQTPTVSSTFTVPTTSVLNKPLRMRVALRYNTSPTACTSYTYGEVEDYNVMVSDVLGTHDFGGAKNDIQLYPNPVSDILNVTKVSDKAAYKIYSAAGQLVESGTINGGKINVSALIKGGYVITIEDKGRDLFKSKFIKK